HIHHLSPRIPNYNLERCHNSHPIFSEVKPLTFLRSLRSINLHLWDEQTRRLVSFADLRRNLRTSPTPQPAA
ncbi:MAG: fatty acid desaturase, partial [Opitutaceae bacterium]